MSKNKQHSVDEKETELPLEEKEFKDTAVVEVGSLSETNKLAVKPEVTTMGKTNKMICKKWCEKHDGELTPPDLVAVFIKQNPSKALTDAEWWDLWNKFVNKKITR